MNKWPIGMLAGVLFFSGGVLAQAGGEGTGLAGPTLEPEGGYRLAAGPCEVATTDELVLHDAARSKDLRVKVRVPSPRVADKGEAKYPMVVFSHGLGGSKDVFGELCDHLCSWGYVVVCPSHADSIQERRRAGEKVNRANAFDIKQMDAKGRLNRVLDCKFIVDSIPTLEEKIPEIKGKDGKGRIDTSKLAVAGHSAGAYTAQLLGGMKIAQVGVLRDQVLVEPRFKAVVVISGGGVNKLGIKETAWSEVKNPWLVITGSMDVASISSETPETRQHPFKYAKGTDKGGQPAYLLFIEGSTHSSYAGKETSGLFGEKPTTSIKVIQDCVASSVLAFLDGYVKGQKAGTEYLAKGDPIAKLSGGKAKLEKK